MAQSNDIVDVLVIGAGASGAALTWSLTQADIQVLCLEQGGWLDPKAFPVTEHEWEVHWQTDFNPDPNFRKLPQDYPVNNVESVIAPYMYSAVGGSTIHWGSHFPRLHPSDFRVRTLDGVADDWPLTYRELEPYFDLNDQQMGTSGLNGDPAYPPKPSRPTPPFPIGSLGEALAKGFNKLGWHWWSSDSAVISTEYGGRTPYLGTGIRSPSSVDTSYWPKALGNGATLRTHTRVREITVSADGMAHSAIYYDAHGRVQEQKARVIVLACNGIGTPRLLLNSQSPLFPNGLANSSGLVGKNLMYHPSVGVIGVFDERSDGYVGPISSTMLSQQFYETDPARGFVRGYEFQVLRGMGPVGTANGGWARHPVPWGSQHHREFDELSAHSIGIVAMSEDLPEEHNDVTLDPDLADSNGIPAPKVRYRMSENTVRMLAHGVDRAREVMEAAGARKVIGDPNRVIGGWHLLGTARMGDDPGTSVVDRWGGSHDVKNLFIIDGSVWVTAGGLNPTPTIQALALRTADYLKGEGRYRVTGR